MSKNIYLTFNYELFLDRWSGSKNILIEPTKLILKDLENARLKYNKEIKATFFIDTAWLLRLYEGGESMRAELMHIAAQLLTILSDGHKIGLLLNPAWQSATRHEGGWLFPKINRYRMDQLDDHEIKELVDSSINLLDSIIKPSFPDFKISLYRATGLSSQPFDKLEQIFIERGIFIDSSVAPKLWADSAKSRYDYRTAPIICDTWSFQKNPAKPQHDGLFTEYPIAVYTPSSMSTIFNEIERNIFKSKYKLETNPNKQNENKKPFWNSLIQLFCPEPSMLSLEQSNISYFRSALKKLHGDEIVVFSHPKFYTPSMSELINNIARDKKLNFKAIGED